MSKLSFLLCISILVITQNIKGQVSGDYRSKSSGIWANVSTWETFNGINWVNAVQSPSSADGTITIRATHIITLNSDLSINGLVLEAGSELDNYNTLTLVDEPGTEIISSGRFYNGRVITGTGSVQVLSGGRFDLDGNFNAGPGVAVTIEMGASAFFTPGNGSFSATVINNGTLFLSGDNFFMAGLITNNGTFNITGRTQLFYIDGSSATVVNNSGGIINATIPNNPDNTPGTATIGSASPFIFSNNGTLNLISGKLLIKANGSHAGSFNINAGKNLEFTGAPVFSNGSSFQSVGGVANVKFAGSGIVINNGCVYDPSIVTTITEIITWNVTTQTFNDLTLEKDLLGTGSIVIANNFCWCGSSPGLNGIKGTGTFTVSPGATATIRSSSKTLDKNFINNGTVNWSTNHPIGGAGTFTNNGILNKSGTASGSFINSSSGIIHELNAGDRGYSNLVNNGEIDVENGSLFMDGSGTHNGLIKMSSGRVLELRGTQNFNSGSSILILGSPATIRLNANTAFTSINFNSGATYDPLLYTIHVDGLTNWNILNQTINNYEITASGIISGTGNLSIAESFCSCANMNNDITGTGLLTILSGATASFFTSNMSMSKTFVNNGTTTWRNNNGWGGSGSFQNNGVFNITGNGTMGVTLTNSATGILNKHTGTGTTSFSGIFNNSGEVNIQNGTIALTNNVSGLNYGKYNISAGCALAGTTSLVFSGPVFTNNGSVTLTNLKFTGTTLQSLNGSGNINSMVIEGAGGIDLGGNQTLNTALTLINGKMSLGANNLVMTSSASLNGGNANSYFVTNGTGVLQRRVSSGSFLFPVGTPTTYCPLTVTTEAGHVADDFKARLTDNLFSNYDADQNPTGSIIPSNVVNRSWILKELTTGGSKITTTVQWNQADQSPGFSAAACRFSTFNAGNWVLGSLSNAGSPASLTRTGITALAPMGVIGQYVNNSNSYAPLCSGALININYTPVGTYNAGNIFTAELSDGSGSFSNPVSVGTVASTAAGVINATIPVNTASGTAYRVRIKSSNPVSTGTDNGSAIEIIRRSNAGTLSGDDDVCVGDIIDYISNGDPGGTWESTNPAVLTINPLTGSALALATGTTTIKYTVGIVCPDVATRLISVSGFPEITSQPLHVTKCEGEGANFSVVASGNNLSYQWRKDGQPLNGQTGSSCLLGPLTTLNAGVYDVIVSNGCYSTTSSPAVLTVNTAPHIVIPPSNTTACLGQPASLVVVATGTGLNYQWRKNNQNIFGETSSILTIPSATLNDAAFYDVVINGLCEPQVISIPVFLTIHEPPVFISSLLSNQSKCAGETFVLSSEASGQGVTYQWFKDGNPIPGATNLLFTINSLSLTDAGVYHVVATGDCEPAALSQSCTLVVHPVTEIINPPQPQTVCEGQPVSLHVDAIGSGLDYQWFKGLAPITGATSNTLTINSVSITDDDFYKVEVTGICSTVSSGFVHVQVNQLPAIISNPVNQEVCQGQSFIFSVNTNGTSLNYQWRKNGADIPGTNSPSYSLLSASLADAGIYTVLVSGVCSPAVESSPATLIVHQPAEVITHPVDLFVCEGQPASFSVTATGTALTYQWVKDFVNISGANSSTYTINSVTPADAGNYWVVINNFCVATSSGGAILTVKQPHNIITHPLSETKCLGQSVRFTVVASGTYLHYQWQKDGVDIPGAIGSDYFINSITLPDAASYHVIVTGDCNGPIISNDAVLTILEAAIIISQPLSQEKCPGEQVSFSVEASGQNLTYQWQFNNQNIAGATNSTYTISAISTFNAGSYRVIISNNCGIPLISTSAMLIVSPTVSAGIINGPASICRNQTGLFSSTGNSGGSWESSNPLVATVNPVTGLVTGLSAGTSDIIYRLTTGCGAPMASFKTIIVKPDMSLSGIRGSSLYCSSQQSKSYSVTIVNGEANLNPAGFSDFEWTISDPSLTLSAPQFVVNGDIVSTVQVSGYFNQTFTLIFKVKNGCGSPLSTSMIITVEPTPDAGTIDGPERICLRILETYRHIGQVNGHWTTSNSNVLQIASSNSSQAVVMGRNPGTAILSYFISGTCPAIVSKTITVGVGSGTFLCPSGPFERAANSSCKYEIIGQEFDPGTLVTCSNSLKYVLSGATTKSQFANSLNGVVLNKGVTTIQWLVISSNNTILLSCSFDVTVADRTPPIVFCPANVRSTALFPACSKVIRVSDPSYTENCSSKKQMQMTWVMTGATAGSSPGSGYNSIGIHEFNVGTTIVTYTVIDAAGNSSSCSFNVVVAGSINCLNIVNKNGEMQTQNNEIGEFNISVYPNPTKDHFLLETTIHSSEPISISITDVIGRRVDFVKISHRQIITFGNNLKAGVYFAEITQGKNRKLLKLIKQ